MQIYLIIFALWLSLLAGACISPLSPEQRTIVAQKGLFSRFTHVKLIPTQTALSLANNNLNKRAALQLDRELIIRLSRSLQHKKIIPTNHPVVRQTLNIIPCLKSDEHGIKLYVLFQESVTHRVVSSQTFLVPYTNGLGFNGSDSDRVGVAKTAQELVSFIMASS